MNEQQPLSSQSRQPLPCPVRHASLSPTAPPPLLLPYTICKSTPCRRRVESVVVHFPLSHERSYMRATLLPPLENHVVTHPFTAPAVSKSTLSPSFPPSHPYFLSPCVKSRASLRNRTFAVPFSPITLLTVTRHSLSHTSKHPLTVT